MIYAPFFFKSTTRISSMYSDKSLSESMQYFFALFQTFGSILILVFFRSILNGMKVQVYKGIAVYTERFILYR